MLGTRSDAVQLLWHFGSVLDDPEDDGRGVLEFKQGFNGYVEELPGEFTLPVNKLRCGVSDLAHKLLRR